jgi:hypothetical protein
MPRGRDTSFHPARRVDRPTFQVGMSEYDRATLQSRNTTISGGRGKTTSKGMTRYGSAWLKDTTARGTKAGPYRR